MPLRIISCDLCPWMLATKPMPQASCSLRGSYNPCASGRPLPIVVWLILLLRGVNTATATLDALLRLGTNTPVIYVDACKYTNFYIIRQVKSAKALTLEFLMLC